MYTWQQLKISDRPARLQLHANVYSDLCLKRLLFLFRLIIIARFVSSLGVFAFEEPDTKLSVNVFPTLMIYPGPAGIRTVLRRFLSRISHYLSSYVVLPRRPSFASRKVYISLETLLCFLQLSYRALSIDWFIPPFGRSGTAWFKCSFFIERRRVYFVYLVFIESVTMVSRDPLGQSRHPKERPYARAN